MPNERPIVVSLDHLPTVIVLRDNLTRIYVPETPPEMPESPQPTWVMDFKKKGNVE